MPDSRSADWSALAFDRCLMDLRVIERHPAPQGRYGADNRFLAGLHRPAQCRETLGISGAHEMALPCDNAGGRAAERLLRAEQHEVGAASSKSHQPYSAAASTTTGTPRCVTSFDESAQRDHAGRRGVVGDNVEGSRRVGAQGTAAS